LGPFPPLTFSFFFLFPPRVPPQVTQFVRMSKPVPLFHLAKERRPPLFPRNKETRSFRRDTPQPPSLLPLLYIRSQFFFPYRKEGFFPCHLRSLVWGTGHSFFERRPLWRGAENTLRPLSTTFTSPHREIPVLLFPYPEIADHLFRLLRTVRLVPFFFSIIESSFSLVREE